MDLLDIVAILVTVAAVFSYINYRFVRLPNTIGLMLLALLASLILIGLGELGFGAARAEAGALLSRIDFNKTLLHGLLSFLLFAGALHVDLSDLVRQRWIVAALATVGVVVSTAVVGAAMWWVFRGLGFHPDWIHCLLFGALISPTDPIAVAGMLKRAGVPKSLETKIAGESLFNDGVGVVVFVVLLTLAEGGHTVDGGEIVWLFMKEAGGGVVLGLVLGYAAYHMLKRVNDYPVEILITLALVTGGYALALKLHMSGLLTMVVAGLLIGNHGRAFAMSDETRTHLDTFWELVDEFLNAVLFVLIGLEVLVLSFNVDYLAAGLGAIPVVLAARFLSVGGAVSLLRLRRSFSPGVVRLLTWGGLRGGISIALALSLPQGYSRNLIVVVTYMVVVFSITVQGLTIGRLLKR